MAHPPPPAGDALLQLHRCILIFSPTVWSPADSAWTASPRHHHRHRYPPRRWWPPVERAVAWRVASGNWCLRHIGIMKDDAWPHTRPAALNLCRLINSDSPAQAAYGRRSPSLPKVQTVLGAVSRDRLGGLILTTTR
jgi:hypothetical protein